MECLFFLHDNLHSLSIIFPPFALTMFSSCLTIDLIIEKDSELMDFELASSIKIQPEYKLKKLLSEGDLQFLRR